MWYIIEYRGGNGMSVKRFNPDINVGLNVEEVTKRYESNLVNFDPSSKTKSFKQIILENVLYLISLTLYYQLL